MGVNNPIVALFTDYGLKDPYVAEVKGVILTYRRDVVFIDVCHEVSAFNELQAAFLLTTYIKYLPEKTIHLCIIDPRVGSGRRGIVVETERGDMLIGPDTGFMIPGAELLGIKNVHLIDESRLPPKRSQTFHGRDVFAHVAGELLIGVDLDEIGPEIKDYRRFKLPEPVMMDDLIELTVMHIDRFGNVITNLRPEALIEKIGSDVLIELSGNRLVRCRYVEAYGLVPTGHPLLTTGGTGFVELAINRGSAAERFRLRAGDRFRLKPAKG